MAIGTVVLLCGYLVVFISVPIVEVAFMRHTLTLTLSLTLTLTLTLALALALPLTLTLTLVEVAFMRHTTVTSKEVSQVLKLVGFQVLATLSTIGSFVGDTGGVINRDWYITGGFMLVNGMMADL